MTQLYDILASRTWEELRAVTLTHGLKFNAQQSRQESLAYLCQQLDQQGWHKRAFRTLQPAELKALQTLQAANGKLPYHHFAQQNGIIRPYRPWRKDCPRHAWKKPHSIAEKLWYLGFVEIMRGEPGQSDSIIAPTEVLDLLPPLPHPAPTAMPIPTAPFTPDTLCHDIAVLLGLLLRNNVKLAWGRWLPPRFLKMFNQWLSIPESLPDMRSELKTERLRFLHYLAETAGLVGIINGYLKPAAAAWTWLDAPPDQQWQLLWQAWQQDLTRRPDEQRWLKYRFPPIPRRAWTVVLNQLSQLEMNKGYAVAAFIEMLHYLYWKKNSGFSESLF